MGCSHLCGRPIPILALLADFIYRLRNRSSEYPAGGLQRFRLKHGYFSTDVHICLLVHFFFLRFNRAIDGIAVEQVGRGQNPRLLFAGPCACMNVTSPHACSILYYFHVNMYFPTSPHPGWNRAGDSLMFLYGVVEMMRLFLASKGNKAEQINPLVM